MRSLDFAGVISTSKKKELKVIQTANWTRDGLVIQRPKTNDSIRRVKLFQNIIDDLKERYKQIEA